MRQTGVVDGTCAQRAEVLPTHTPALFAAAVDRAVSLLRAGEVVALPTETVYGLAANALDRGAVEKIFRIKGRPSCNPVIVHVAGLEMARQCVAEWPAVADQLAQAFWPGPLTLVLPKAGVVPSIVTAGGETVGVRWPGHPFIQAVLRECKFPLAAPSANPSGQLSPTNAGHVLKTLGDQVRLIVDGGPSQVGIESTVVDLTSQPLRVLRPGMIHRESLLAALDKRAGLPAGAPGTGALPAPPQNRREPVSRLAVASVAERTGPPVLLSPGQLPKHYAPRARLVVSDWQDEAGLRAQLAALNAARATTHIIAHTRLPPSADLGRVCVIPREPEAFARALYAELHRCDEEGATLIVVEAVPTGPAWAAIEDRLRRAAA